MNPNCENSDHSNDRSVTCDYCGLAFARNHGLKTHVETIHLNKKFKCEFCKKEFTQSGSLKRHIETVHEGKRWPCDLCKKVFMINAHLKLHVKYKHLGEKPERSWKCDRCEMTCASQTSLALHISGVHEKIMYDCNVCSNKFTQKGSLQRHIRDSHLEKQPKSCRICEKIYQSQRALVHHTRECHENEKSYQKCPICGKSYLRLDRHMKEKHQQMKYPCEICGKNFSYQRTLEKHIEVVHEKPTKKIKCEPCGKMINESNFKSHNEKVHSNKMREMSQQLLSKTIPMLHTSNPYFWLQ